MSLQINLLPEARMDKLQAASQKRLLGTIVIIVGLVAATIIVTLLLLIGYTYSIYRAGESRANTLKKDISSEQEMEQNTATLQENLAAFAQLQKTRLYVSEIFANLSNVIPADINITSFEISTDYIVTISGTATSFSSVSSFSKALQDYNVNFKPQADLERKPLFTELKISSVSKDNSAEGSVNFTMSFKVDPTVFNKQGSE